jgi:hypothetical protein
VAEFNGKKHYVRAESATRHPTMIMASACGSDAVLKMRVSVSSSKIGASPITACCVLVNLGVQGNSCSMHVKVSSGSWKKGII